MNHQVHTSSLRELAETDRRGMFRLRYDTFVTRLGWDVQATDGQEIDEFDQVEDVQYILAKAGDGGVDA